jgi:acyl dehydratase
MKASELGFEDIHLGMTYSFSKKISKKDVMAFADLTGDFNPLHTDDAFGTKSQFGSTIVHGMLAGSLFSTLVGMYCPGKNALYLSQSLQFRHPILPGDTVEVRGTVSAMNGSTRMITLKTEIVKDHKVCISGEAIARVQVDKDG